MPIKMATVSQSLLSAWSWWQPLCYWQFWKNSIACAPTVIWTIELTSMLMSGVQIMRQSTEPRRSTWIKTTVKMIKKEYHELTILCNVFFFLEFFYVLLHLKLFCCSRKFFFLTPKFFTCISSPTKSNFTDFTTTKKNSTKKKDISCYIICLVFSSIWHKRQMTFNAWAVLFSTACCTFAAFDCYVVFRPSTGLTSRRADHSSGCSNSL